MDNPALDTIISAALRDLEQLGVRLNTGHDGVCLLMTRDILDYIMLAEAHKDFLESCTTQLEAGRICRFHGYDIYFVTSDSDGRLGAEEAFILPAIKRERVILEEIQDGDIVVWDNEVFRYENVLRSTQAMVTRNYHDAPLHITHPNVVAADRVVGHRADALIVDELADITADGLIAPFDRAEIAARVAAIADDLWDHDLALRYARAETAIDNVAAATAEYARNAYVDVTTTELTDYINAGTTTTATTATTTGGYVNTITTGINLDGVDWGRITVTPTIDWDRGWEPVAINTTDTWTVTLNDCDPFFEDVPKVKSKRKKEPELKRSKALDDFIDQFAPKN